MKKLLCLTLAFVLTVCLAACQSSNEKDESSAASEANSETPSEVPSEAPALEELEETEQNEPAQRQIQMTIGNETYPITLYETPAADALYELLPLELTFEDFNGVEKIAYLPDGQQLSTEGEPDGCDPSIGDLCLYAPWGNLSLFYQDFDYSNGLISLGRLETGIEELSSLPDGFTAILEPMESSENEAGSASGSGEETVSAGDTPAVYMTTNISSEGLMAVYEALGASPSGNVAVKLSTGEPGSNYLRTDLIGDLVQSLDAAIVECNTAYGGSRANTAMHYQVAEDHGYTAIADVDIMDEEGSLTLPVTGGDNLTENYVGSHFENYDYYVILSHFKGHAMAGFGGAIKNISIGIASAEGKAHIHSGGTGGSMWSGEQDAFLESMAEAGKSVVDALDKNILYINVMNRLSVDCDCDGSPAEPDMHDIGILASFDPVAVDQACIDLVYAAEDGASLVNRIESRNGLHTLEQGEKIGLGSREYQLISIDE